MMRFFHSVGLENISGEYAYQEYRNTNDISYLARAFEIAADNGKNARAEELFEKFYGAEDSPERAAFEKYCAEQTTPGKFPEGETVDYRSYVCARAVCVKYRLAKLDEDIEETIAFAIAETGEEFLPESPAVALAVEAIDAKDDKFCEEFLAALRAEKKFNRENRHYITVESNLAKISEVPNE